MQRNLRRATAILLGLGALAVIGLGVYLLSAGGSSATYEEVRSWSPVRRSMFVVAQSPRGGAVAAVFIVMGLVAGALGVTVWRGLARWPLVLVAVASVILIPLAQWSRGDIESSEPRGYREKSVYVQAARALATSATVYLVALLVLAAAAWWLSRPTRVAAPPG